MAVTIREFLEEATCTRQEIETFLDPSQPNACVFDSELGYLPASAGTTRDGIDGSYTIFRSEPTGERKRINYADRPCRINTYGDSFTQGCQVSDGETWQEYLAAHLGEPIRNFGVGGYGVYQAYRRLLREEQTPSSAPYVILNIWASDDHFRSLDVWRWLRIEDYRRELRRTRLPQFHANPWTHLRIAPDTGEVLECPNPYPTPEALYKLCDRDHVYRSFRDDFALQMFLAMRQGTGVDLGLLRKLAATLDLPADLTDPKAVACTARLVYETCAFRASMYIVRKLKAYTENAGKKLMVFLTYSDQDVIAACEGRSRRDLVFVNFLKQAGVPFVDGLQKHVEDYASFSVSPDQYAKRYYIGHYRPQGNHFLAYAVKDAIIDWLEPKPPVYDRAGPSAYDLVADLA